MRALLADFRYALRVLSRAPSFSLAVISVLALGIGANTAIFSIVNAVLLRPLPFDQPEQIVRLFQEPPQSAFPGVRRFAVSPANFYDWQRDARSFDRMAIYRTRRFALTGTGSEAEAVIAGAVGADFFSVLRAKAALGRVFLPEEDTPGKSKVVVLSDGFWKTRFGGAADAVGKTLTLDGEPYTVVGVMDDRFSVKSFPAVARAIWVPLAYTDAARAVRENHNAQVVARLKAGVDERQAQSEMQVLSTQLERAYPQENAGWGASVVPLRDVVVGDIRLSLIMLLGAVTLVLLIACANVGNLLFARALTRRKEIAIRTALGARRSRVIQQLLVEAITLALLGGAAGLLLAQTVLSGASALLASELPRADEIAIDGRVLLFVFGVSLVTGILAGALPALRAGWTNVNDTLKVGGRNEGTVGLKTRRMLIVCEVALSIVLLMGAAVTVRTLLALRNVDAGFNAANVLTMQVSLPRTRYAGAQNTTFFDTALERIRALPGVESAGAIDDLPLLGGSVQPIVPEGQAELSSREQPTIAVRKITPGYLRSMGIPLLQGRDVAAGDTSVLLVSRAAARLLWGDKTDPIGRRVTLPLQSRTAFKEIIGVVGDVKQGDLAESAVPSVYEYTQDRTWNSLTLVVRTSGVPPETLAQPASGVIHAIDPQQPVEELRTMDAVLDETLTSQRFNALLLGMFAVVALALASVGIYSVVAYIVRGRSREIGIRAALGARTPDILRLVIIEGMTPALIGIAAGAVAAVASATILRKLVFGVSASDPLTLAGVAVALALVAFAASLVPAWRAARLDVLKVLREG